MGRWRLPTNLTPGTPFRVSQINSVYEELRRLNTVKATGGITYRNNDGGIQLGLAVTIPRIDVMRTGENIEAGKKNKASTLRIQDPGASSGDADQTVAAATASASLFDESLATTFVDGSTVLGIQTGNVNRRIPVPVVQWHLAKLDEGLDVGSSAAASVWTVTSGSFADATFNIVVHDWYGIAIPSGTAIMVFQHAKGDARRYYAVPPPVDASSTWADIDFRVDVAFTDADATFDAEITAIEGDASLLGGDVVTDIVTVVNKPSGVTAGGYQFSGSVDWTGWARVYSGPTYVARGVECDAGA